MKQEIPTWAVVLIVVVLLGLIGAWYFSATSKSASDVVVEKSFGDESNPFGNQTPPARPQAGQGASGP